MTEAPAGKAGQRWVAINESGRRIGATHHNAKLTDQQVDDAFFAELRKHFTEAQVVELTAAIAMENFRSKFNPTLGVEAQGFCMVPQRKKD